MLEKGFLFAALIAFGAGWGFSHPLTKIAVSEGYRHFGLIFWQLVLTSMLMALIALATRRKLVLSRPALRLYLVIAIIGTVLPNAATYQAAVYLPSGILSILLSLVPMLALPIALLLGNERFEPRRLLGLMFGLVAVLMIALPEASLPERAMLAFIPLAMIAPLFYAFEGNYVARWGTAGLDAVQVLLGGSLVGVVVALPLALGSGQWIDPRPPWGAPDYALMASAVIHGLVYTGYVWIIGRAGAVFAAQVSYLVMGFGVVWAMLFLGERYSLWVWAAFAVMLIGLALVQPRARESVTAQTH
ncbi:MAG: DMT family transporter [Litoreibacter sp.]|nr:DMT family transporter [Litoreibacter sp.]MCY4336183.1 DMT family transporter [Litoreibacter sp.]